MSINLERFGIPFNGTGWNTASGAAKAAVALITHDPERLEIEIAVADGSPLADIVHNPIQAKVGLEFLPLEDKRHSAGPSARLRSAQT